MRQVIRYSLWYNVSCEKEKRVLVMRIFYVDIYFLINLTVDILALYFSAAFSKSPTTSRRLVISGLIGAASAVLIALLPEKTVLKILASASSLFATSYFATKRISFCRKMKFIFSFLIFEALLGGLISFVWGILDTYAYEYLVTQSGGGINRRMLFFSLIILLSIGVFKMIVSFFSNIESEGVCRIEIKFIEKTYITEAFIDSGNLAKDPMDMRPVILLKKEAAEKIFPENVVDLRDPDSVSREIRRRIRLIPISRGGTTHVLTGVRVDGVYVINNDVKEEISVTVAIDKEGGTFGGYYALMPSCALGNVSRK